MVDSTHWVPMRLLPCLLGLNSGTFVDANGGVRCQQKLPNVREEGRDCIYNPNVIAEYCEYCGYDFEDKEMQSDRLRSGAMPSDLKSVARTPPSRPARQRFCAPL